MSLQNKLGFGTAGIRGRLGEGETLLNESHVARTATAYAKYLLDNFKDVQNKGVVIGRDNRLKSKEFAQICAFVLSSYNIKVYFHEQIAPTPFISYSIRYFKAIGGINITASHNPKEYNGIKIYDELGCQILPERVSVLQKYFEPFENFLNFEYEFKVGNFINLVPESIFNSYIENVLSINEHVKDLSNLKVVYSPQHGTGARYVKTIFDKLKVDAFYEENEMKEDPYFTFAKNPNPEDPNAYKNSEKIAKQKKADIILLTDPDSDRVGLSVLNNKTKNYEILTGNETAILITEYLIENKVKKNKDKNYYMIYSFVSSSLPKKMANENGIKTYKVATGFKWIGNLIEKIKLKNEHDNFLFAFEESYGSLVDENIARDKDAIQSIFILSLIASFYKKQCKTIIDVLDIVYKKYGYVSSETINIDLKSFDEIKNYLQDFKNSSFNMNEKFVDYHDGFDEIYPSKMYSFEFANDSWVSIRPSGTEPKIKIYILVISKDKQTSLERFDLIKKTILKNLGI